MRPRLVLFEDEHWRQLSPLTDLLPVPALAFGVSDLATRWERAVDPASVTIEARPLAMGSWVRPRAAARPSASPAAGDTVFAMNAAALPGDWLRAALESKSAARFTAAGRLVGARLPYERAAPGLARGDRFAAFLAGLDLPAIAVEARVLEWPWQLIEWNAGAIAADLAAGPGAVRGEVHRLAAIEEPGRVTVEAGARVDAYAVLDAREGPIHLGAGVIVRPHTVVTGPCVVGEGTHLLGGAIGHSTIGPGCRLGGEVDACVFQGWANKRHHGFIGHSAIGAWANLGALTTTSDLKNNYGTVRVRAAGREVDTGLIKLGSLVGAGVKTGIGTLLPTGAVIGTGSHLFGGGRYAPKHLPAFSWWDGETTGEYRLDEFLATARVAMRRRDRSLTPDEEAALRSLFEATASERRAMAGSS